MSINTSAVATPAWMARIPDGALKKGGRTLLVWLEKAGLPRPPLLELEAERTLRGLRKPVRSGRR